MGERVPRAGRFNFGRVIGPAILPALLGGCVLAPPGTKQEQARLSAAGRPFEPPVGRRELPELPAEPTWRDVLRRAFLANGDLEASYFEWKAAVARIPQAAGFPNTNLAPQFSYLFSPGRMKSFDRASASVGFDPMQNLSLPAKIARAGRVALEEARAAGMKFFAAKFELQRKVLTAYLDLALHEEKLRIRRDNAALLKLLADAAADHFRAGGNQQDLLKAQTQLRLAESERSDLEAEHLTMTAMLNALMARAPDAPLRLPRGLPPPRPLAADDARLIALATDNNPELAALARQVAGRADALELARLQYLPDVNPFAAFTGSLSQSVGAMVVVPLTFPQIRGRIDEARAMLRSAEAALRQARTDRAARFVASLYVLRNAERQAATFQGVILPRAEQALASSRQSYTVGTTSYIDLIDSQRTLLDVKLMVVEAKAEREKRLAELEALAGVDVETLVTPATVPATSPATGSPPSLAARSRAEHGVR